MSCSEIPPGYMTPSLCKHEELLSIPVIPGIAMKGQEIILKLSKKIDIGNMNTILFQVKHPSNIQSVYPQDASERP